MTGLQPRVATLRPRRGAAAYHPPDPELTYEQDALSLARRAGPVDPKQARLFDAATSSSAPKRLHLAGDLELLEKPAVAIVGTREVSEEGARRARRLARELAEAGVVVMSGLARGVDTHALTAALDAGGRVVAVIGTPLDKAYPAENGPLQERIHREQLLISPFAEGTRTFPSSFPIRNRVMAALSRATVIIEASDTSGTLHQAAECARLGRWLFIAASAAENPALTWPAGFLGKPRVAVLSTTADVLERIRT